MALMTSNSRMTALVTKTRLLHGSNIGMHVMSTPSRKLFHDRSGTCRRSMLPTNTGVFNLATNLPMGLRNLMNTGNGIFNLRSFNFSTPCAILSRGLNFATTGICGRMGRVLW